MTAPLFNMWLRIPTTEDLQALRDEIREAERKLAETTAIARDRAALISIVRTGRVIRFGFVRNGQMTFIEMMGTWDDDVDAWRAALLSPLKGDRTDGAKS